MFDNFVAHRTDNSILSTSYLYDVRYESNRPNQLTIIKFARTPSFCQYIGVKSLLLSQIFTISGEILTVYGEHLYLNQSIIE